MMGHVSKLVTTHNRFDNLTKDDEEAVEEGEWKEVTGNKKPKKFTTKAKIHLTTRKICNSPLNKKSTGTPAKAAEVGSIAKDARKTLPDMERLTERLIANAERVETAVCQMTFHVTDANKVLASVNKMTEAGNQVNFNRRRSYIESPDGKRAYLRKRGGVYVLDVVFFDGENAVKGEVIVDSGAADNVMPKGMLTGVVMRERERGTKFVAADGGELGNYGRKDVQFCPLEFWEAEFGAPFQGRA